MIKEKYLLDANVFVTPYQKYCRRNRRWKRGIFYPESDAGQSVQSGSILIQSPWPDSHFGIPVWAGIQNQRILCLWEAPGSV